VQWGDGRVSVGFDANAWPIHADGGLP